MDVISVQIDRYKILDFNNNNLLDSECYDTRPQQIKTDSSYKSNCFDLLFSPLITNLCSYYTCLTNTSISFPVFPYRLMYSTQQIQLGCQRGFLNFPGSGAALSLLLILARYIHSWDTLMRLLMRSLQT